MFQLEGLCQLLTSLYTVDFLFPSHIAHCIVHDESDLVQAHCCVGVNEEEVVSDSAAAGVHQNQQSISRTFRSVDLSQLVYNCCIPVEKDLRIETSWI